MKIIIAVFLFIFLPTAVPSSMFGEEPPSQDHAATNADENAAKELDAEIARYTKWVKEIPQDDHALEHLAAVKERKGDLDDALAAYAKVIKIRTEIHRIYYIVDAYENRGALKQIKGDFQGAIHDYTTALSLGFATRREKVTLYYLRGITKYLRGDLKGALTDFRSCTHVPPAPMMPDKPVPVMPDNKDLVELYVHFDIWIVLMRLGKKTLADQELINCLEEKKRTPAYQCQAKKDAEWLATHGPGATITHPNDFDDVAHYFLDPEPNNSILYVDSSSPFYAYSHSYYAGMKALLAGDKDNAISDFNFYLSKTKLIPTYSDEMVVSVPFSCHRQLAEAELKLLEK